MKQKFLTNVKEKEEKELNLICVLAHRFYHS